MYYMRQKTAKFWTFILACNSANKPMHKNNKVIDQNIQKLTEVLYLPHA